MPSDFVPLLLGLDQIINLKAITSAIFTDPAPLVTLVLS